MKKIFSVFFAAIVALVMVSCGPSMNSDVKALKTAMEGNDVAKVQECMDKITDPSKLNGLEEGVYASACGMLAGVKTDKPAEALELMKKALTHMESAIAKDKATLEKEAAKEGVSLDEMVEALKQGIATWEQAMESMNAVQAEPTDTAATEGAAAAEATEATQE